VDPVDPMARQEDLDQRDQMATQELLESQDLLVHLVQLDLEDH